MMSPAAWFCAAQARCRGACAGGRDAHVDGHLHLDGLHVATVVHVHFVEDVITHAAEKEAEEAHRHLHARPLSIGGW